MRKFPNIPSYRFIGRSGFIRQAVNHLCSPSTVPTTVLIAGEHGSGKTALALQLLHNKEVRTMFGDGDGCLYIDCKPPLCSDGGQKGAETGVGLVVAILEQLNVELHPTEKDILVFLYNKLIGLGSKTKVLLVLDGLEAEMCLEENRAGSRGLTMKRVIKTLASIYCVSLVVTTCEQSTRQLLPGTLVLPGTGTLGPLELKDAIEMFEEISKEGLDRESGSRHAFCRDDISKLLEFQSENRLPLGVMLLAKMQKFHYSPLEILQHLEEHHNNPENTRTSEGLTLIFDILLRSTVLQTKAARDVTRLMRLLAYLPEGLPDYNQVLSLLASNEYLDFEDPLGPGGLVEMLTKSALAEKRASKEGVEALVVSRTIKKYFRINPEDDPSFVDDLNTFIFFIDQHRKSNEDVVLALGSINIYHVLTWLLNSRQDHVAANMAYDACYLLFKRRSSLNENLMSKIRSVNEGLVAAAEGQINSNEGDEGQVHLENARRRLVDFLLDYARLFEYLHQSDKTREIALEAEALANKIGDGIRVGESLMTQGQAALMDACIDDLYTCNERASKIYETLGSEVNLARALQGMAYAQRLKDRYEDSQALGEKACELFRRNGEQLYCVDAIYGLGITFKMIGKYDEALKRYEEAQELSQKSGDLRLTATIRLSMGSTLALMDRSDAAMEKFEESYQLFQKLRNQVGMAKALDEIGDALCGMKRFEEAMEKSREAYTILKSFGNSPGMGNALNNWGCCLQALDKKQEAANKFREALDIFERAGLRRGRANSMFNLAKVLFLLDHEDESIAIFQEASSIYSILGVYSMAGLCKWWQATVYDYIGSKEQATVTFNESYEIYEKLGDEDSMRKVSDKLQSISLS